MGERFAVYTNAAQRERSTLAYFFFFCHATNIGLKRQRVLAISLLAGSEAAHQRKLNEGLQMTDHVNTFQHTQLGIKTNYPSSMSILLP